MHAALALGFPADAAALAWTAGDRAGCAAAAADMAAVAQGAGLQELLAEARLLQAEVADEDATARTHAAATTALIDRFGLHGLAARHRAWCTAPARAGPA